MIKDFLVFLPAYVANATPTLLGGALPLDSLLGAYVFGKNKTLRGLIAGFSAGVITAWLISGYVNFWLGVLATLGALFGDLFGSYIKRLLQLKEGSEFLWDQFFYAYFALAFVQPTLRFTPLEVTAFLLISFFIHRFSNFTANRLGLKKVPW
jgi:CDP-2,3-bis-(O-geranylgeranyl)-sn-glycerol synthase